MIIPDFSVNYGFLPFCIIDNLTHASCILHKFTVVSEIHPRRRNAQSQTLVQHVWEQCDINVNPFFFSITAVFRCFYFSFRSNFRAAHIPRLTLSPLIFAQNSVKSTIDLYSYISMQPYISIFCSSAAFRIANFPFALSGSH